MKVLIFALFFSSVFISFGFSEEKMPVMDQAKAKNCQKLFQEIKEELKKGNFCEKDGDCKEMSVSLAHQESFGCKQYLNQKTDTQAILNKMEKYKDECGRGVLWMEGGCFSPEGVVCENKKCVAKPPENLSVEDKEQEKEKK